MPALLGYWTAFALLGLSRWLTHTFGPLTVEQVIYHVRLAETAALKMGRLFSETLVMESAVFPLLFALVVTAVHHFLAQSARGRGRRLLSAMPPLVFLVGFAALLQSVSAFSWVTAHFEEDRFAREYVDPRKVQVTAKTPRNLILIYVESLEASYADAKVFPAGLLQPLEALGGQRFDRFVQSHGVSWTMAGMVATQCGVPLAVDVSSDFAAPDNTRVFMPSAVCLGDLLVQQGFRNVFMGGAHLTFAGKGTFLRDHGYSERYGRTEWENAGAAKSEFNEVGMYDSALFDRARIMLSQLHAGKAPYNLTLLTLDTHSPGFYSERCRAVSGQRIERVVACSTSVVSEFVRFARDQGYLDNTLVVIIGDHLAHPNEAQAKLEQIPERRIFNLLLSPSPVELSKRAIVHYDWFPTLAQALGLEVAGGRLGLGYSAIEAASPPPTDIRQRIKSIPTAGSAAYSALWSAP